jgi:hypothetical protein
MHHHPMQGQSLHSRLDTRREKEREKTRTHKGKAQRNKQQKYIESEQVCSIRKRSVDHMYLRRVYRSKIPNKTKPEGASLTLSPPLKKARYCK